MQRRLSNTFLTLCSFAVATAGIPASVAAEPGGGVSGTDLDTAGEEKTTGDGPMISLDPFAIQPPGHVEPLRFNMLLTLNGYLGPERVNDSDAGFEIGDARLVMGGELEHGFGYFLQANLIDSRPLLDLIMDWKTRRQAEGGIGFGIRGGFFRTPFSGELLIAAPNLDFIDRSQIVRALAPGRQIGLQIDQQILGDRLVVRAGAFNGNGFGTNDDERLLYVLRFDGRIRTSERPHAGRSAASADTVLRGAHETVFEYGLNGAYSEEDDIDFGLDLPRDFAGKRWLAGADLRVTSGPVFFSAEGLYGSLDPNDGSRRDVYGYQTSIGWDVTKLVQLLARYDALYAGSLQSDRDLAIGSITFQFTRIVSLQLSIRVPTRGEDPEPGGAADLSFTF